jgi:hypothetical protein
MTAVEASEINGNACSRQRLSLTLKKGGKRKGSTVIEKRSIACGAQQLSLKLEKWGKREEVQGD